MHELFKPMIERLSYEMNSRSGGQNKFSSFEETQNYELHCSGLLHRWNW
jgi:hypothetical protein